MKQTENGRTPKDGNETLPLDTSASKATEIALVRKLVEIGGYFAEFFGADLDKMVENIRNDFPIETGTRFHDAIEKVGEMMADCRRSASERVRAICERLVGTEQECVAVDVLGRTEVIRIKQRNRIAVSWDEVQYLLEVIDGKEVLEW